jgi:hypothetical protein
MADVKISQLPAASTPLAGTEQIPLVQDSTTKQITVSNLLTSANLGTPSAINLANATNVPMAQASGTLAVANGGTGTATPALVAGTNVTISGSWPNQTINSTYSGAVTSVTGTAPVVSSGGTTPAISMAAATGSVNGYLTSTDWTTFNNKLTSGGALGTPSSGTATNLTGLPLSTGVTGLLPVANGGTGTATPALVAGSNVTISGTWPNQTIAAAGAAQVYPGAGIANSTGSAWGTSYSTSGSGTVVALATSAALTNPSANQINDTNGAQIVGLSPTASAVDYLTIKNGIGVGVPLHVYADGSSTNVGLHIQPKGSGLVTISDGTDFNKGIRFRSSGSAASAVTLLDAVSTAGRVVTLPDATTTLVGRDTTDTLTNKTIAFGSNTFSGTLAVANGGTGTATPALVAGTNVTITGTWPNQTIAASGGGGSGTVTSVSGTGTVNGLTLTGTVTTSGSLTLGGTLDLSSPPAIGGTTPAAITGTVVTATTKVVTPYVDAVGSGGGQLRNASGTSQLAWGAGGGSNLTLEVATNINPANAAVSIAPTGTGTVTINPATAGTINNMSIGATTPSTGAFTTLSASGAVTLSGGTANGVTYLNGSKVLTSGSALTFDGTNFATTGSGTLKNLLLSGGTLPAAGNPSIALRSSDNVIYHQSGSANNIVFLDSAQNTMYSMSATAQIWNISNAEKMRLDSSGNLGLGVTPSAWTSAAKVFEVGSTGSFSNSGANDTAISDNRYYNGTNNIYKTTNPATIYSLASGQHRWFTAPSGTAGNAISFIQAMTLDASGNLAVGITSYRTAASYNAFALNGTTGSLIDLYANSTRVGGIAAVSSAVTVSSITAIPLVFSTSDTERARINSGGLFSINSTGALVNESSFAATSSGNTACIKTTGGAGTNPLLLWNSGTTGTRELISFSTGASFSSQGGITSNGTVLTYGGTSDYRLKEISGALSGYKERILAIQPKQGTWKTDNSEFRGFLAHEFAEQYPASVIGEKDAVDTDGNPKYQSMQASSSEVMADLIAMVKDLIAENESLKARLDAANL